MKKTLLYILTLIVFSSCLQKNQEVEATSYLQQGYESEYSNKDTQALLYYKKAEQMAQTSNNRKLHFLIYTAIGKLNAKHAHYEIAMDYFRKAIDLKLSAPLWHFASNAKGFYLKRLHVFFKREGIFLKGLHLYFPINYKSIIFAKNF